MCDKIFDFNLENNSYCVFTAIHNGSFLSQEFLAKIGIDKEKRLQEEDPYTDFFAKSCKNNIINYASRFWFDINRTKQRAVYKKPEDAWGLKVRSKDLTQQEIDNALNKYDEFYMLAAKYFDEIIEKHGKIIVFDLHSYNYRRGGINAFPDDPKKNPEIILGTSNMEEKYFDAVKKVQEKIKSYSFLQRSLDVRVNVKFPGGNFPRWFNNRYKKYGFCIAVEFKKIFMNEWTGQVDKEIQLQLKQAFNGVLDIIPSLI